MDFSRTDVDAQGAEPGGQDPLHGAPLLVRSGPGQWEVPHTTTWDEEKQLRDLVREQPTLIPGVTDPVTPAVIEFPVPGSGYADVVAIEADGRITICEVKLSRNPEIRRKIVGQLLAYAAGISQMSADDFLTAWNGCRGDDLDLDDLGISIGALGEQLASGKFRLVFVVDGLTEELRSVVSYLVDQTSEGLDVVAVEIEYARHDHVEILIPKTFGAELSAARSGPRRTTRKPSTPPMTPETMRPIVEAAERRVPGAGAIVEQTAHGLSEMITNLYLSAPHSEDALLCTREPKAEPVKFVNGQKIPGVRLCLDFMQRFGTDRLGTLVQALRQYPELARHLEDVEPPFKKRPLIPYATLVERPDLVAVLVEQVQEARPER